MPDSPAGALPSPVWTAPPPETRWLLRLPNWIGDAVMALPALRALPREGQRWIGVAHPRVLPLYEATGLFPTLLPATGGSTPLRLAPVLRRLRPDRALVFTEAFSGALLARWSGAPLRLGRTAGPGRSLLTHGAAGGERRRPLWEEYLRLAALAGARSRGSPEFRIAPGPPARVRASEALAGAEGPWVALAPGASYGDAKRWPAERFAALARRLRESGLQVVVLGSAAERDLGAALAAAGARDLTGRLGLTEALAVLERCRGAVTNDSGAMHLARAAGTPVVGIFGSTSPVWTGPLPHEGEVVRLELDCSPCFRRRCPLAAEARLRCLRGIPVEAVEAALRRVMEGGTA